MPVTRWIAPCAALAVSSPAAAELIEFEQGDVMCIDYEAKSHSCAGISIVRSVEDGLYVTVERARFDAGNDIITLTIQGRARKEDDLYCMLPNGIDVAISPPDAPMTPALRKTLDDTYAEMTQNGMCADHEACGKDYIARFYIDGVLDTQMATSFTLLKHDDPKIDGLALRTLSLVEALSLGQGSSECVPET